MSLKGTVVGRHYVIAKDTMDGIEFLALTHHGYPFWTSDARTAHPYTTQEGAAHTIADIIDCNDSLKSRDISILPIKMIVE